MTIPAQQYVFKATIKKVVDGDTLDADIDLGLHCHRLERLRLLRVNTPEMRGATLEAGRVAKAFVQSWLAGPGDVPLASLDVIVQTYKSDVFGRYLAEVWRASDGANLSDDLLSSGNGVPYA